MSRNECGSGREGNWELESQCGGGEGSGRALGLEPQELEGLRNWDTRVRDIGKCACE